MTAYYSEHFTLEALAEGVYAVIHKEGGWAVGNAGIVDLGDRTLVFDTFLTPRAARDLRRAAEELTGKPIPWVINSHYHNDHIWGNQVFDEEAEVISTFETRQLITTRGAEEVEWYRENSQVLCDELKTQLEHESDERQREVIAEEIIYYEAMIASLPELTLRPPSLAFSEKLVIHGQQLDIELIPYIDGHTRSDTVLYLPTEGIVFMGDLLFVGSHPYLIDGDPENLITILEQIMEQNASVFVPGHGPVAGRENLGEMVVYVKECERAVREFMDNGGKKEEISQLDIPEFCSDWDLPHFYHVNAKFIFQKNTDSIKDH